MNGMIDMKGVIAALVVLASFAMLGAYVWQGKAPDAVIIAVISGALNLILGFYFGHMNGSASAMTNTALSMSNQAVSALAAAQRVVSPTPTSVNINVPPTGVKPPTP
jgi:hypothetical protein